MKNQVVPKARKENLVVQELDSEVLIYDLNTNKAFCLNETSTLIWQACNEGKTVAEISKSISKKLNSPVNEDLVWLALDQLKKENLIENKEEIVVDFGGMSRREVIRKVGLATVVALPLVSSLVAPLAIHAVSAAACGTLTCHNGANGNSYCVSQGCGTCNNRGICSAPA